MRPDKDTRVSDIPMSEIQVARHETKADNIWNIIDAFARLVSCSECTSCYAFHTKENAGSQTGPFLAPPSGPGNLPSQQHQQVLLTACCPRLIRMIHAAEKTRTCTVATHSCKKSGPFSFRGSCVIHLASVSFRSKHSPDLFYLLHVTV